MPRKSPFSLVLPIALLSFLIGCARSEKDTTPAVEDISLPVVDENYYLPIGDILDETFPDYNTLYFSSGMGYEIRNDNTNKLIIALGGGPGFFGRRMRLPGAGIGGGQTIDLFLHLKNEYSFFVPEKFDWSEDRRDDIFYDIKERERFTIDNLIMNYAEVIGEYLSQNNYETVIIAGFSEGGFIVPELYFQLEDFNISGLVSIATGGLPLYEGYRILYNNAQTGQPPFHFGGDRNRNITAANYAGTLEHYRYTRDDSPEPWGGVQNLRNTSFATTYRYLDSLLFRMPIEFYREIDIPVLFLHGEMDVLDFTPLGTHH